MMTIQVGDHNKINLEFNVLNIKILDEGYMLCCVIKNDLENI